LNVASSSINFTTKHNLCRIYLLIIVIYVLTKYKNMLIILGLIT